MKLNKHLLYPLLGFLLLNVSFAQTSTPSLQVKVEQGILEGTDDSGIRIFRGVPFAAPPVGDLRWREPQPAAVWTGVRPAKAFAARPIQRPLYGDMNFRSQHMSEDCLYLNIWTPAQSTRDVLPVLVYFFGGGLMAGDASEYRYDGESLARQGMVTITVNYRLNIFGFFSHPELTSESPHHASGNYGFLDQRAALQWVKKNIAAFGGDPGHITIAGESAGSFSVSAQMASPLGKQLFQGAICESGAITGKYNSVIPLEEAEKAGAAFAGKIQAPSLAALRKLPAEKLLEMADMTMGPLVVDGYFFEEHPAAVFEKGEQAQVPLLAGWNSAERSASALFRDQPVTVANFQQAIREQYGELAGPLLSLYPATAENVWQVATDLGSDQFIAYGTWRLTDLHARTSKQPVYRYYFSRPRPAKRSAPANDVPSIPGRSGASHSAEIEYALGNLPTNRVYDWQPEDYKVSRITEGYFARFIKTFDPNGPGAPYWPRVAANQDAQYLHIDVETRAKTEQHRARYLGLEKLDHP